MPDQVIQKKLTDEQRKWVQCGMSRTDSLVHFLSKLCIPIPQELTVINTRLREMDTFGTTDGKPWVEPEPPIPPGYRKAEPHEYKRMDVKMLCATSKRWVDRLYPGKEFSASDRYIVPCRPSVQEGWRVANEDECHRSDIMTWEGSHDGDRGYWRPRPSHKVGKPFNGPDYLYIVPIDSPLTDEDACVWPRPLVMVRDEDYHLWEGPFRYIGKDDDKTGLVYLIFREGGHRWYKQARRATPAEIESTK